ARAGKAASAGAAKRKPTATAAKRKPAATAAKRKPAAGAKRTGAAAKTAVKRGRAGAKRKTSATRTRPAPGGPRPMAISAGRPTEQQGPGNPLVAGLERLPVAPTTLVIFGATGDLARRKLLPALYNLAHEGALPERFHLVGIARKEKAHEDY